MPVYWLKVHSQTYVESSTKKAVSFKKDVSTYLHLCKIFLSFTATDLSSAASLKLYIVYCFYKNDVQTQIHCVKSLQTSWQSQNVYVQSLKWHKSSLLVDALAAFINHFLSITVIPEQSQSPCIADNSLWLFYY